MNERQEFALLNPLNSATPGPAAVRYRAERVVRGLLLRSILAVDR